MDSVWYNPGPSASDRFLHGPDRSLVDLIYHDTYMRASSDPTYMAVEKKRNRDVVDKTVLGRVDAQLWEMGQTTAMLQILEDLKAEGGKRFQKATKTTY
jgi:hypothetical protein